MTDAAPPPEAGPAPHAIDAEIFSAGTWNDERFTVADLHEIARNFRRLRGRLTPPLKFGHDEAQTLLGQRDGDPALGWVERLWVAGDKLMARFAGVPRVVVEAIRAGRYRRVSAELYFDVRLGRRRLGKALKAVALLGADLPAVTNLNDLTAYLAAEAHGTALGAHGTADAPAGFAAQTARAFALPVQGGRIPTPPLEETTMGDPHLETRPDPGAHPHDPPPQGAGAGTPDAAAVPETPPDTLPDALPDALRTELAELRAYKSRREQHDAETHRRRQGDAFRSAREGALAFCSGQVRAGRLPPHLLDRLQRELDGQARHFGEGQPLRVSFDWVRRLLESLPAGLPPTLPQGETAFAAAGPQDAGGADDANPSAALARLAANAMAELNLSYGEAAAYVLRTQPSLARAYRDYTLNPST